MSAHDNEKDHHHHVISSQRKQREDSASAGRISKINNVYNNDIGCGDGRTKNDNRGTRRPTPATPTTKRRASCPDASYSSSYTTSSLCRGDEGPRHDWRNPSLFQTVFALRRPYSAAVASASCSVHVGSQFFFSTTPDRDDKPWTRESNGFNKDCHYDLHVDDGGSNLPFPSPPPCRSPRENVTSTCEGQQWSPRPPPPQSASTVASRSRLKAGGSASLSPRRPSLPLTLPPRPRQRSRTRALSLEPSSSSPSSLVVVKCNGYALVLKEDTKAKTTAKSSSSANTIKNTNEHRERSEGEYEEAHCKVVTLVETGASKGSDALGWERPPVENRLESTTSVSAERDSPTMASLSWPSPPRCPRSETRPREPVPSPFPLVHNANITKHSSRRFSSTSVLATSAVLSSRTNRSPPPSTSSSSFDRNMCCFSALNSNSINGVGKPYSAGLKEAAMRAARALVDGFDPNNPATTEKRGAKTEATTVPARLHIGRGEADAKRAGEALHASKSGSRREVQNNSISNANGEELEAKKGGKSPALARKGNGGLSRGAQAKAHDVNQKGPQTEGCGSSRRTGHSVIVSSSSEEANNAANTQVENEESAATERSSPLVILATATLNNIDKEAELGLESNSRRQGRLAVFGVVGSDGTREVATVGLSHSHESQKGKYKKGKEDKKEERRKKTDEDAPHNNNHYHPYIINSENSAAKNVEREEGLKSDPPEGVGRSESTTTPEKDYKDPSSIGGGNGGQCWISSLRDKGDRDGNTHDDDCNNDVDHKDTNVDTTCDGNNEEDYSKEEPKDTRKEEKGLEHSSTRALRGKESEVEGPLLVDQADTTGVVNHTSDDRIILEHSEEIRSVTKERDATTVNVNANDDYIGRSNPPPTPTPLLSPNDATTSPLLPLVTTENNTVSSRDADTPEGILAVTGTRIGEGEMALPTALAAAAREEEVNQTEEKIASLFFLRSHHSLLTSFSSPSSSPSRTPKPNSPRSLSPPQRRTPSPTTRCPRRVVSFILHNDVTEETTTLSTAEDPADSCHHSNRRRVASLGSKNSDDDDNNMSSRRLSRRRHHHHRQQKGHGREEKEEDEGMEKAGKKNSRNEKGEIKTPIYIIRARREGMREEMSVLIDGPRSHNASSRSSPSSSFYSFPSLSSTFRGEVGVTTPKATKVEELRDSNYLNIIAARRQTVSYVEKSRPVDLKEGKEDGKEKDGEEGGRQERDPHEQDESEPSSGKIESDEEKGDTTFTFTCGTFFIEDGDASSIKSELRSRGSKRYEGKRKERNTKEAGADRVSSSSSSSDKELPSFHFSATATIATIATTAAVEVPPPPDEAVYASPPAPPATTTVTVPAPNEKQLTKKRYLSNISLVSSNYNNNNNYNATHTLGTATSATSVRTDSTLLIDMLISDLSTSTNTHSEEEDADVGADSPSPEIQKNRKWERKEKGKCEREKEEGKCEREKKEDKRERAESCGDGEERRSVGADDIISGGSLLPPVVTTAASGAAADHFNHMIAAISNCFKNNKNNNSSSSSSTNGRQKSKSSLRRGNKDTSLTSLKGEKSNKREDGEAIIEQYPSSYTSPFVSAPSSSSPPRSRILIPINTAEEQREELRAGAEEDAKEHDYKEREEKMIRKPSLSALNRLNASAKPATEVGGGRTVSFVLSTRDYRTPQTQTPPLLILPSRELLSPIPPVSTREGRKPHLQQQQQRDGPQLLPPPSAHSSFYGYSIGALSGMSLNLDVTTTCTADVMASGARGDRESSSARSSSSSSSGSSGISSVADDKKCNIDADAKKRDERAEEDEASGNTTATTTAVEGANTEMRHGGGSSTAARGEGGVVTQTKSSISASRERKKQEKKKGKEGASMARRTVSSARRRLGEVQRDLLGILADVGDESKETEKDQRADKDSNNNGKANTTNATDNVNNSDLTKLMEDPAAFIARVAASRRRGTADFGAGGAECEGGGGVGILGEKRHLLTRDDGNNHLDDEDIDVGIEGAGDTHMLYFLDLTTSATNTTAAESDDESEIGPSLVAIHTPKLLRRSSGVVVADGKEVDDDGGHGGSNNNLGGGYRGARRGAGAARSFSRVKSSRVPPSHFSNNNTNNNNNTTNNETTTKYDNATNNYYSNYSYYDDNNDMESILLLTSSRYPSSVCEEHPIRSRVTSYRKRAGKGMCSTAPSIRSNKKRGQQPSSSEDHQGKGGGQRGEGKRGGNDKTSSRHHHLLDANDDEPISPSLEESSTASSTNTHALATIFFDEVASLTELFTATTASNIIEDAYDDDDDEEEGYDKRKHSEGEKGKDGGSREGELDIVGQKDTELQRASSLAKKAQSDEHAKKKRFGSSGTKGGKPSGLLFSSAFAVLDGL